MKDERSRLSPPRAARSSRVQPTREYAELKAAALLAQVQITQPPVDVLECARVAGIALVVPTDLGQGSEDAASAVLMQRDNIVTALINKRQSPVRQRFSLAHEIGHWVLERIPGTKELAPIASRSRRSDALERVCDHFAANLLMPRLWVQARRDTRGVTTEELAKIFDVSVPAMRQRLREI